MSECDHVRRIGALLDDELPPAERRRLEQHAAKCATCAQELERLRALRRFLRAAAAPELSPETLRRLHGTVVEPPSRNLVRLATRLTLAAAAVLALCVGWLLHTDRGGAPPQGREPSWAMAAVTLSLNGETETSTEAQLARWMAEGLALESTHD